MMETRKRNYIIFMLPVSIALGLFSMLSDSPVYFMDDLSAFDITVQIIAGFLNDLITWFALAILVGYVFSRSIKQALTKGACFAVTAILMYFFFSALFGSQPPSGQAIPINSLEFILVKGEWLLASAVGGAAGGLVGFVARTHHSTLLIFPLFIVARLTLNGASSWQNFIGVAQNSLFIALGVALAACVIFKLPVRRQIVKQ